MINIIVVAAVCLGLAAVGYISTKYLGPDNVVEEEAEELIEDEIEDVMKLPHDSLKGKIDLTPHKKQDK